GGGGWEWGEGGGAGGSLRGGGVYRREGGGRNFAAGWAPPAVPAASERHRRVQAGRQPDRPVRGRGIDHNPECRLFQAELQDHLIVLGVDRHRMTHSAVAQNLLAPLTTLAPVPHDIERQHRAELFDRQRVVAPDPLERRQEYAGVSWYSDAALFCDDGGGFPHEGRVRQSLRRDQSASHRLHLRL